MAAVPIDILAALRRGGLIGLAPEPEGAPLKGGVSSDIWRIETASGPVCVKRALPRLKVKADWRAPVERNTFEARWMEEVASILPAAAPRLLYVDTAAGALVMPFLPPEHYRLWKTELLEGRAEPGAAAEVGRRLVAIHAATAGRAEIAARFPTDAIFHDLRLEPYLQATAGNHPDLARSLRRLARRTAATKLALIHGDVSPKNILLGPEGPVFLDAECAWYGDPAFDLAFCLTHLLLKARHLRQAFELFLELFDRLADAYLAGVVWERRMALEARAAALLPALLLARVDGKSPVEYLTAEADREAVRRVTRPLLQEAPATLAAVRTAWAGENAA